MPWTTNAFHEKHSGCSNYQLTFSTSVSFFFHMLLWFLRHLCLMLRVLWYRMIKRQNVIYVGRSTESKWIWKFITLCSGITSSSALFLTLKCQECKRSIGVLLLTSLKIVKWRIEQIKLSLYVSEQCCVTPYGERAASCPVCNAVHWLGGCMGSRDSLIILEARQIACCLWELNYNKSVVQYTS